MINRYCADWILEADIKGCFDHIDHKWLNKNIPMNKKKLQQWLKCGYLEKRAFNPSDEGTPQGGIISPTLANMALDGIQSLLADTFRKTDKIHFVRYADDFIITGRSPELLETCVKPMIEGFLRIRGLELSEEKTMITHIDDGFNVRKYKGKLLIKPSKPSIKSIKAKVRDYLHANKTRRTDVVIAKLNTIIRGWANYYKHVVSRKVFGDLDHAFWQMTWRWARRRHPKKYKGWVKNKYYRRIKGRDWRFVEKSNSEPLILLGPTRLIRHTKTRANVNPYDPAWVDYLKARWKRRQLSGVATRLINA